MEIAKPLLQLDVDYSAWANLRLLEACSALAPGDLTRDFGYAHRSVLHTLQHIYEGEQFWSDCLQADRMPPLAEIRPSDEPPNPDFATLRRAWPLVWSSLSRWFAALREEDLALTIASCLPNKQEVRLTRWQLIRHLVNHSSLHRGQISGMLRVLGHQPPNVDILSFYLELTRTYPHSSDFR